MGTIFKKGVENQDTYHQDPGNLVSGFLTPHGPSTFLQKKSNFMRRI